MRRSPVATSKEGDLGSQGWPWNAAAVQPVNTAWGQTAVSASRSSDTEPREPSGSHTPRCGRCRPAIARRRPCVWTSSWKSSGRVPSTVMGKASATTRCELAEDDWLRCAPVGVSGACGCRATSVCRGFVCRMDEHTPHEACARHIDERPSPVSGPSRHFGQRSPRWNSCKPYRSDGSQEGRGRGSARRRVTRAADRRGGGRYHGASPVDRAQGGEPVRERPERIACRS